MDGAGVPLDARRTATEGHENGPVARDDRDLAMKFESLGGSGHGSEFASFQQYLGYETDGLLAWADLGHDLLIAALESRFDGVGLEENTIVFAPDHSDEWWTKDKRYWMAMRSFLMIDALRTDQATAKACTRLRTLRQKLIDDLETGRKIFVFKTMYGNLSDGEIGHLHAAVSAYGNAKLFYVGQADGDHPAGTVSLVAPGLLVGYMAQFVHSSDKRSSEPVERSWLALCQQAVRLQTSRSVDEVISADEAVSEPQVVQSVGAHRMKSQRARKIVLIGNCQMQAMAGLYKRFVAGRTGDVVEHVPSYQDLSDEHRSAIQQADVVVEQLFDLKPQVDTETLSTTTPRLFIPMVTAAFLWPFAGSPHPKNSGLPYLVGGPYGGEASDSYLNRLILSGVEPEEAVETYANLDVNKRVNLDRLFEIVMDRQRSRDEAADYQIAGVMEQYFRTEQIFLSPYHPNVRIATTLASQFFARLGAQQQEIDRMRDCTRITPFPKTELPFHPGVCRHFGLDFVAPDRLYRFMNEGLFTFREYALRYMRYEWNDVLEEGMHLSHIGQWADARDRLTAGVARSPRSAAGHNALGHVLNLEGATEAALAALRRAVDLEPDAAPYRANLGNLLRQTRNFDAALVELRAAVVADPVDPHYRVLLAHLLRQQGQGEEACDLLRQAIRLDPYAVGPRGDLANMLEATGDLDGAVEALHEAIQLAPADEAMQIRLAQLLGRLNRFGEAIEIVRQAVARDPESTRVRVALSDLLLRSGEPTDALNEAYVAAVTEPDSAHAYGHLGHVLSLTGDARAAEVAFRRAAKLDPDNAHFHHEISMLLKHQDRLPEAIAAARAATEREPRNPHRFVHLAALLAQSGDLAAARTAQRQAVTQEPGTVVFRVTLSDLFARDGQYDDALTEAAIAVDSQPNSAHALGHMAHVLELKGALDRAEETLRRALEIEPRNDHWLRKFASLQSRRVKAEVA
jgi:tetratricopeptide (TPR) repeat protein